MIGRAASLADFENLQPPEVVAVLQAVVKATSDDLPDDDDNEPLRVRRNKRASADKTPQSAPASEAVARDGGDTARASVTFAIPLTSVRPSMSTADPSLLFAPYPVPEDQAAAAKEAIRQAGIMMEQVKLAREASQAAYNASSAL